MKRFFNLILAACLFTGQRTDAQVLINELYTDPSPANHEFFELYNTNPSGAFSVNNLTMVTFFEISGQRGFYVLDMPNMSVAARDYFVGSAALPFNYQGKTNSTASDFNWNSAALAANQGYMKKWVQGTLNLTDGNLFYDEATVPANFNDFFFRRSGSGASYTIFLYNNGQLINSFIGGAGGSTTVSTVLINMPALFVDMTGASADFTINFSGYGSLPVESTTQDAGSDNGYIRTRDGSCGSWDKSSSSKQHTPKATNGTLAGYSGSVAVSAAINPGNVDNGSVLNYDIVSAPASYFPIEMQVYADAPSMFTLNAADIYITSKTENVVADGPFYSTFYPYNANILIAVKASSGCLDRILFIPNALVLSVKMVSFEGNLEKNIVNLTWKTEDNEQASRFEIQRSSNGKDYTTIASLDATGKAGAEQYSYSTPIDGNNKYSYRLRIYNKNGKADYSNSLMFQSKQESANTLTVIGNPAQDKLQLQFESAASQAVDILVSDMNGRVLYRQKNNCTKGVNRFDINLSLSLNKGMYIVDLTEGLNHYSARFIK